MVKNAGQCLRVLFTCAQEIANFACVNTKNWYRKETDLWAEYGKRAPFGKRFSSKHSVKTLAVGSTPSFGTRAVSRLEEEAFGNM
jgi:hypothetical protein